MIAHRRELQILRGTARCLSPSLPGIRWPQRWATFITMTMDVMGTKQKPMSASIRSGKTESAVSPGRFVLPYISRDA